MKQKRFYLAREVMTVSAQTGKLSPRTNWIEVTIVKPGKYQMVRRPGCTPFIVDAEDLKDAADTVAPDGEEEKK